MNRDRQKQQAKEKLTVTEANDANRKHG